MATDDSECFECPFEKKEGNEADKMEAPNQQPSKDQPFYLPKRRQISSIPNEKNEKWVYPSQQMFWNAMKRKGWKWKQNDISPKDMSDIVQIHNSNNEQAWLEILRWENFTHPECKDVKLIKFGGRAQDFTPKARIRSFFGYKLPFDRHDWWVNRCGKDVRYIIDYYDNPSSKETTDTTVMDIRPAIDSFSSLYDRSKVSLCRLVCKFYFSKK